jgi:hypothetical protein
MGFAYSSKKSTPKTEPRPPATLPDVVLEEKPSRPATPAINLKTPNHLNYNQIVEQIKTWSVEAPELAQPSVYGKSKQGKDIWYLKVGNTKSKQKREPVLLMSCIHGNETWATGVSMAYIGNLLADYGKDAKVTELLDTRDIYFVPVVCPDSYTKTRLVDGVDPNRDFPTPSDPQRQSSSQIMALRHLFFKVRPKAVISAHTYGRVFLIPYGDKYGDNPHQKEFDKIVGDMAKSSDYKMIHCSELYAKPISGTEVDFFYRNGSMAVVIEMGTHQHIPSYKEITSEYQRVKPAISKFLLEAPEVHFSLASEEIDFSRNTGIAHTSPEERNGSPGQEEQD